MNSYWTPADVAELDVLVFEFVRVHALHVPACATCRQGPWCSRLRASFEAILDWKQARTLRSKAEYLRAWVAQTEDAPAEREFATTTAAGKSRWTRNY